MYDGSETLRYLGGEEEKPEPDQEHIGKLQAQLAAFHEGLACFAHEGWAHVRATLEEQLTNLIDALLSAQTTDIHEIGRRRGAIEQLRAVLGLPDLWRAQASQLSDELNERDRDEADEPSPAP